MKIEDSMMRGDIDYIAFCDKHAGVIVSHILDECPICENRKTLYEKMLRIESLKQEVDGLQKIVDDFSDEILALNKTKRRLMRIIKGKV